MDIFGILPYLSALLVGFVMGLLGGGGSILTIPIFVYLFGIAPVVATAYSLFVVGATATVGTLKNFRNQNINLRIGLLFGIPSFIGTYLTRRYILPNMPDHIFSLGTIDISKDLVIMILFAIMMISASISMIRSREKSVGNKPKAKPAIVIVLGLIIGLITGVIGAGGGFIIVPALIFLTHLDIKIAIGTSLFVIMMKSFIGFLGDLQTTTMDWNFLFTFAALAAIGILVGVRVAKRTKAANLKQIFGWFILIVGVYVIFKEVSGF